MYKSCDLVLVQWWQTLLVLAMTTDMWGAGSSDGEEVRASRHARAEGRRRGHEMGLGDSEAEVFRRFARPGQPYFSAILRAAL